MLNSAPGVLAGIPLEWGNTQLGESWVRRVQWGAGGLPPGQPFLWYGFTVFVGSSKGPSGEEAQAYPVSQVNSATGPSHFAFPNGSLYKTKACGMYACFAQDVCLWVTLNYHHNSKSILCIYCQHGYIAGRCFLTPLFCLFSSVLKVWWALSTIAWPLGL